MATTLEIINGISQVLSNSYDGALDESGEVATLQQSESGAHSILKPGGPPVWLYNAIWAALGAALALAALTFMFDW